MKPANDTLRDEAIRHALHAADYDAETAARIGKLLNSADEDISDTLARRLVKITERGSDLGPATTNRLTDMLTEVRAINSAVYSRVGKGIEGELIDRAGYEAAWAGTTLERTLSLKSRVDLPPAPFLRTLVSNSPIDGHLLASWTDHMSANRQGRVEQAIRLGLLQGENTDKIVARIMGTKAARYEDGILQISRRSCQTLVLTASATVANNARIETYRRSGLIKALKWIATLDTRTTPICQSRDGTVYPIGETFPQPPAHPRCRSILIPVTKSFKELGVDRDEVAPAARASMDGQVAGDTDMEAWVSAQPPERQAAALKSEARAELFRTGKVSWRQLFNDQGGYRSIADLRAAEGVVTTGTATVITPDPEIAPEPTPEAISTDIRNPAVTDETIIVEPRLAVQKRLSEELGTNAKDFRYDPRPQFRGVQANTLGKASFSTAFTDEATSMVAAILPELDALAVMFHAPKLRAVRTVTGGGTVANMGDGVLGLNPPHFNAFAGKIGKTGDTVAAKAADLSGKAAALAERIDDLRTEIRALYDNAEPDRALIAKLSAEQTKLYREYHLISKKAFEAKRQAQKVGSAAEFKPSEWKPGDDLTKRPHTVDHYFSGMDRARSVMYHEMGHHVHQTYAQRGHRNVYGAPPIERLLDHIWAKVRIDKEATSQIRSKYAFTNSKEWFAEQFALYFMGRKDMASVEAVKLIEELIDGTHTAA